MNLGIVSGTLLLLLSAIAHAQDNNRNSLIEPELRAAMVERTKVSMEGDTEKIQNLMSDDYIQTDIVGRVQNKSEWLAEYFKPLAELIKAGKFRWDKWKESDIHTQSFGNTVIVVGRLDMEGTGASIIPGRGWVASPESHAGPLALRFTRVWIKKDGKWLLAAVHNASLPQQSKK